MLASTNHFHYSVRGSNYETQDLVYYVGRLCRYLGFGHHRYPVLSAFGRFFICLFA